ncbi:hypothetical protein PM082_014473 [Marasmius tenuissimus]|nr:hypothetical protein PM082_014473 [Marasmius tenuissimus]
MLQQMKATPTRGMPTTKRDYQEELERLEKIIRNKQQRREVLSTTGDEAQEWLNLMQLMMIRLSRTTGLHPRCLTIQNADIVMMDEYPVGGGAFGDVWKGRMGLQDVCVKVLRVYSAFEAEQVLKARNISSIY